MNQSGHVQTGNVTCATSVQSQTVAQLVKSLTSNQHYFSQNAVTNELPSCSKTNATALSDVMEDIFELVAALVAGISVISVGNNTNTFFISALSPIPVPPANSYCHTVV